MAGTIAADTLTHSTAGSLATNYIVEGSAKQWVRFSGSTMSIADSFNTSSVTDNGTGDYTPNLTNSMASENYAPQYSSAQYHELVNNQGGTTGTLAGAYKIAIRSSSNVAADTGRVSTCVLGDLA
jgi:hypothetical protein|tara:strand:- start:114 stop:488 length:375 start_codon:yes stop_codon:yes gene_type:complete